ncbi:MAG: hypothetical protein ACFBQW_09020 [Sphingomonadaceae bacterium]
MRSPILPLLAALALASCQGYALDYLGSKPDLLAPELARYGLDRDQRECMSERLAANLTVWQLRQLADRSASVEEGYFNPERLGVRDLLHVAAHVEDAQIAVETARAADACKASSVDVASLEVSYRGAGPASASRQGAGRDGPAVAPVPPPVIWINLGAAATGQKIALDAGSVGRVEGYREGWFRLTDPGEDAAAPTAYRLRIDCAAKTIVPMALRRYDAAGEIAEERDYGPEGEETLSVERGTVMEIAWLSLCT